MFHGYGLYPTPGGRKSLIENYQSSHKPTEDGRRAAVLK